MPNKNAKEKGPEEGDEQSKVKVHSVDDRKMSPKEASNPKGLVKMKAVQVSQSPDLHSKISNRQGMLETFPEEEYWSLRLKPVNFNTGSVIKKRPPYLSKDRPTLEELIATPEAQKLYNTFFKCMKQKELFSPSTVISKIGNSITLEDAMTLGPKEWLHDAIIDAYLNYSVYTFTTLIFVGFVGW